MENINKERKIEEEKLDLFEKKVLFLRIYDNYL